MPSKREAAFKRAMAEYVQEQVERVVVEAREEVVQTVRRVIAEHFKGGTLPSAAPVSFVEVPVKRGPGRPRKYPLPVEAKPKVAKSSEFTRRSCNVSRCKKPHRAKGYCISHYDRALRLKESAQSWPIPCPKGFVPFESKKDVSSEPEVIKPATDQRTTRTYEVTA